MSDEPLAGRLRGALDRWGLAPDGDLLATRTSFLQPVHTAAGEAAILKISHSPEERFGAEVMAWWGGQGAAKVLAHEGDVLLLERAAGERSLAAMARGGDDDEATRVICGAAEALHGRREDPPAGLTPLDVWFRSLFSVADSHGGLLVRCAETACELLAEPKDMVALHGDLHHGNVLDFGPRGWLAIDPKGLLGERGFDFANLLRNPDPDTAQTPGRLARQADVVAEAADLDRTRLLMWALAWFGLSAVWMVEDGEAEAIDLTMAEIAAAELDR
ncbi:aminoglycoside phosphotransferase family protein [Chenggangzhangella methanolivorans]|uniref:3'-kinase n=1 Tax=Chenggangzhangella methanolivorans TaxID=1437009 RepID=A0A9E6UHV2_9HYPH|nr:aminoglycoside phosphotransferase family protein [Chenggangzhangella methanolivorans]QZO00123.1 3'-kinase [Chenggangzhangella methanolivorans]